MVFLFPQKNNFKKVSRRAAAFLLIFCFILEQAGFAQGIAPLFPAPAEAVIAEKFRPVHLRFVDFNEADHSYNILLAKGDARDPTQPQLESSARDLMTYFFIGLQLPNSSFWVNLRPDTPERVIDDSLAKTDIGRIMLAADVQLKKDLAAYTSPRTREGREYWDKLYKKAEELFGSEDISIPTVTRPWIVPDEIILRQSRSGAYIYKATLKVLLESDYLKEALPYDFGDTRLTALNEYSSGLVRKLIIPRLSRDVNISKKYAALRQVYYSLVLAQWLKSSRKEKTGGMDREDLTGLTSKSPWTKDTYFNQYKRSFEKGEYDIQDAVRTRFGQTIRRYFSGGIQISGLDAVFANAPDASGPSMLAIRANPAIELKPDPSATQSAAVIIRDKGFDIIFEDAAPGPDTIQSSDDQAGASGRKGLSTVEDNLPSSGAPVPFHKDGGSYEEQIQEMWKRFSELYSADIGETFVASKLRSVGKTAVYLPTISIQEDDLPEGYSTAGRLRPQRDIRPLPQKLEDIDRVSVVPVKQNGEYVVPYSHVNNGSMAVVLLGKLPDDGTPVVLKTYPGRRSLILSDYQGAQLADDLGIGPRAYGLYVDADGREWTVADLVPGDFSRAGQQAVTRETLDDFVEMHQRLRQQNIYPYYDFQYFLTPHGRLWVIDPMSLVVYGLEWDLAQYSQEYKSELEALTERSVSPPDGGACPADEIIPMFGLDKLEHTPGIAVSEPRRYRGYSVRRAAFDPGADLPEGLALLKKELYAVPGAFFGSIDLVYNDEGRLIAVFPVITDEMAGAYNQASLLAPTIRYLNLAYFYHAPPQVGDPDMTRKWDRIIRQLKKDMAAVYAYKDGIKGVAVWQINSEESPYIYVEIDRANANIDSYELLDVGEIEFNPRLNILPREPDPAKYQLVLTVFPTVYSPAAHVKHDRGYYSRLCRDFDLRPGQEVLVVGPGVGLEAWLVALKTKNKVSGIGINPFEVANLIHTSRIAGFQVDVTVGDNIITPGGQPRFNARQFDRVVWNMPVYRPAPNEDLIARAAGRLESFWDGDFGGKTLKRFARGLLTVLKPDGEAIVWNEASFAPPAGDVRTDRVEEILKLNGELAVASFEDIEAHTNTYFISRAHSAPEQAGGADYNSPKLWYAFTGSAEQAAQEVKARRQDIDYEKMVGTSRVLFLGSNHLNLLVVAGHIAQYAREFKRLGITHYAIEAQPQTAGALEKLNKGEDVDLSDVELCPEQSWPSRAYEDAVRAFAREGITVVPVDMDHARYRGAPDREKRIHKKIRDIIARDPDARIVFLTGAAHASKGYLSEEGGSVRVLLNNDNIATSSVFYAGGWEIYPEAFTEAVHAAGLAEDDFMVHENETETNDPFFNGEFDHIVHLGETDGGVRQPAVFAPADTGGIDLRRLGETNTCASLYQSAVVHIRERIFRTLPSVHGQFTSCAWDASKSNDINYIRAYIDACVSGAKPLPGPEIVRALARALENEEKNGLPSDPAILELLVFAESGVDCDRTCDRIKK